LYNNPSFNGKIFINLCGCRWFLIDLDRFAAKNQYYLLLVPPFVLEDSNIGEITDKLATTFDTVMPPA